MRRARQSARVIAITSGKGGVGKTSTSVNLAIALATRGLRTLVLDADLGLANVEVLLGISSLYNIEHVIEGERKLHEIIVKGPGGIHIIPGSSGLARIADLSPAGRERILNGLAELQQQTDFILLDTMAGIGKNAVAFAAAADEVLLVTTPEPSAIVDAYAMLKTLHTQNERTIIRLIVNMAANPAQAQAVAAKLANVAQQYLGRNLPMLGFIPRDPHVSQAVMQSCPFTLKYPAAPSSKHLHLLADALLLQQVTPEPRNRESFLRKFAQTLGIVSNA